MRGKVKKLVSVNIPDYGNLRIVLLENGIILNSDNTYFQHRGTDLTIFEALCKIGFPVNMENIKLVQKALGETIYIVKFHKSSIYDGVKSTNASVWYLNSDDGAARHRELNFYHKIGDKEYTVFDNATVDNNMLSEKIEPSIQKYAHPRKFNSKFLRISDGITDDYWEEARVAQRIYDRENVDESLPDDDIKISTDIDFGSGSDRDHNTVCVHINGNKGDITICKDICGKRLMFTGIMRDINTSQETSITPIDPIVYLNNIGIRSAKNISIILKDLGVSAYHILQFPSHETKFAKDYKGHHENEKCIVHSFSISEYANNKGLFSSDYGYEFSESVEVISSLDGSLEMYFFIIEPEGYLIFMPENMQFSYRTAIEKFRKEDPKMSGGTVYLNKSDMRAHTVFFDE